MLAMAVSSALAAPSQLTEALWVARARRFPPFYKVTGTDITARSANKIGIFSDSIG
jgi:hypothetical protein